LKSMPILEYQILNINFWPPYLYNTCNCC
jgi:hypothetical protein